MDQKTKKSRVKSIAIAAWPRLILAMVGALCVVVVDRECPSACVRYQVNLVSMGCSGFSTPQAISPSGDVVGTYACGFGEDRSFVAWGGGSLNNISLPNQYWSDAHDINSTQHVTGTVELLGTGIRAYLYVNGVAAILEILPNHDTGEGFALNASDVVVGYSANTQVGPVVACRWLDGKIEALSLPLGPASKANDISDQNQIVGWMGQAPGGSFFAEAFLWNGGNVFTLVRPPGATSARADAINETGATCGAFWFPNRSGTTSIAHPILWMNPTQFIDLGVLPGTLRGWAFDLNDANQVVGYCNNPAGTGTLPKAFLWRDGVMVSLDSLRDPGSLQYQIWYAYGINNNGQIAAAVKPPTGSERAAVLTPLPPHPGDTNCDWLTNIDDLVNIITEWNTSPTPEPFSGSPDVNEDGTVNIDDLVHVIVNWG